MIQRNHFPIVLILAVFFTAFFLVPAVSHADRNSLKKAKVTPLRICENPDGNITVAARCSKNQVRIKVEDLRRPGPQGLQGSQGPQGVVGPTGPQGNPGAGPAFSFSGSTDFDQVNGIYKFYPVDGKLATGVVTATAVEPDSPLVNSACTRLSYRLMIDAPASPDGVVIMRLIRLEPFVGGINGGDTFLCSISSGSKACSGESTLNSAIQPGDKLALTVQHPGALTDFTAAWNIQCIDHLRN